jgi:hypothetical protein
MNRALTALLLLLSCGAAWAQISISTSGSWSRSVGASDLTAGAGSDLAPAYESAAGAITVSISGTAGGADAWRIDVKKVDASWIAALRMYVRRTDSGSGGSVSGGTTYQQVTDADLSFFDGAGDVSGIGLQVQVGGVSVSVPPAPYATTVYFTVVDN